MNVRCDPDQGGCGTLFTVGATMCPNCQRTAENVAVLNPEGLQPRELDAVDESGPEDVSDLAPLRRRSPRRTETDREQDDEKQEATDE